jgi:hypothetical protein
MRDKQIACLQHVSDLNKLWEAEAFNNTSADNFCPRHCWSNSITFSARILARQASSDFKGLRLSERMR